MTRGRWLGLVLWACAAACGSDPAPRLQRADPATLRRDRPTRISLFGDNFLPSVTANAQSGARTRDDQFQATVGALAMTDVVRVSATQIDATCPAGAPLGSADVTVTDPRGRVARLPAALMMVDGATTPPRVVFEAPSADASFPADAMVHVTLFARAGAGGLITDLSFDADQGTPMTSQAVLDPPLIETRLELDYHMPTGVAVGSTVTLMATASDDAATPNVGTALLILHVAAPTPGPHVFAITPARGPTTGGQDVVIQGANFTPQTRVRLDGLALVTPTFVSDGELHGTTPAHPGIGRFGVRVTDVLGDETLSGAYEYAKAPLVVAIEPRDGLESGGTPVTVTGYGFDATTAVELPTARVTQLMLQGPRSLKGVTPPGSGLVDVVLLDGSGAITDRLVKGFHYWPRLSLTDVKPSTDMVGRTVRLVGAGFTPEMRVRFGSAPAMGLVVQNQGKARIDVPAGTGTVDVTVSNPVSTSTLAGSFTYR